MLYKTLDTDRDYLVNVDELQKWIVTNHQTRSIADFEMSFKILDVNSDGKVDWPEYFETTFGFPWDADLAEQDCQECRQMKRDKILWEVNF